MQSCDERLLNIVKFHLGKDKAERYVKHLAKKVGIPIPKGKNYHKDIFFDFGEKQLRINFSESIRETQENGVPYTWQHLADSKDRYLAPAMSIAISKLPNGLKAEMTSNLGRFSQSVQAPGLIESPETSLANDILYFRKMTCENSSIDNIEVCSRYFRSYLLSCISLIDCFLSRYSNFVKDLVEDVEEYKNTSTLASTSGIETRIDAWFVTFAYHEIENYKKSTEWVHFQRIRGMRNMFVHPPEPIASYSIKEIAKYLNYCNEGVGGLLGMFRSYTSEDPNIGFINKVKTAPKVTMCAK